MTNGVVENRRRRALSRRIPNYVLRLDQTEGSSAAVNSRETACVKPRLVSAAATCYARPASQPLWPSRDPVQMSTLASLLAWFKSLTPAYGPPSPPPRRPHNTTSRTPAAPASCSSTSRSSSSRSRADGSSRERSGVAEVGAKGRAWCFLPSFNAFRQLRPLLL